MSTPSCDNKPSSDWLIQIPLSELVALQGLPAQMGALQAENAKLRRELEGLRNIAFQTLEKVSELRREVKSCQPKG